MIYTYVQQRQGTLLRQLTPPYEYMSTPGNKAKPGTARCNIQPEQNCQSLAGIEPTMQ